MNNEIMFLDVARRMGVCEGEPGGTPRFQTVELAPQGAAHHVLMGAAIKWAATRFQVFRPRVLFVEAPLNPMAMGGKSNPTTIRNLIGLVAAIEGTAERCGINSIREVHRASILSFTFPEGRPSGNIKQAVITRMRYLGHEVWDDNSADGLAGWYYGCAQVAPQTSALSTPLFGGRGQ